MGAARFSDCAFGCLGVPFCLFYCCVWLKSFVANFKGPDQRTLEYTHTYARAVLGHLPGTQGEEAGAFKAP